MYGFYDPFTLSGSYTGTSFFRKQNGQRKMADQFTQAAEVLLHVKLSGYVSYASVKQAILPNVEYILPYKTGSDVAINSHIRNGRHISGL